MKNAFLFTQLHHILNSVLENHSRSAIVTPEGEALYVRSETLSDIATLPATALTCMQYLSLGDGDVGLCNDPYSGGGILSNFSLVAGVSLSGDRNKNTASKAMPSKAPDVLIVIKLSLKPRVTNSSQLDDEGLRIPPTPIVVNGELNHDIFSAMAAHPKFPKELTEALPSAIEKLRLIKELFRESLRESRIELSKQEIKEFLKVSAEKARALVHELAAGEAGAEFEISSNEKLKVRTEIHDDKITFDFSGSDVGTTHFLTFAATFGACVGAVFAFMRKEIPVNAGTASVVQVIAKKGTIVNANFPKPVALGLTDGLDVVANLALRTLSLIDKHRAVAYGGGSHCAFELRFSSGAIFYDRAHPGSGATSSTAGVSGQSLWWRARLNTSIEEIERRYPLRIESTGYRAKSGGAGAISGGDGMAKTYRLLEPAEFLWNFTDSVDKPLGQSGGKSAAGPEILVLRDGEAPSKKEKLKAQGSLKLQKGDQIWILAGGGGGYGEAKSSSS